MVLAVMLLTVPPGFDVVRTDDGCTLSMGPKEPDGVAPMLAQCRWPEVGFERLTDLMGRFDAYDQYIWAIVSSTVLRVEDGRTLVHQVQRARPLAMREVALWMAREPRDDGGVRFTWTTAKDEPLEVPRGHVRAPRNEGHWQIHPHPDGGVLVEHRIAYDAGGTVPSFLVRRFQTGGLSQVMSDVRAIAGAATLTDPEAAASLEPEP